MKKMKFLLLILFGTMILSCSSDDNGNNDNEITIIGKWKLVSGSSESGDYNLSQCLLQNTIEFNSGLSAEENNYSDDTGDCLNSISNFTYETNGNEIIFHHTNEDTSATFTVTATTFTYTINGTNNTFDTLNWLKI